MLNESIPRESAKTASSMVLRMTWLPSTCCPDSSTVTGTNVSNPNSNSRADILVPFVSVGSLAGRWRGHLRRLRHRSAGGEWCDRTEGGQYCSHVQRGRLRQGNARESVN